MRYRFTLALTLSFAAALYVAGLAYAERPTGAKATDSSYGEGVQGSGPDFGAAPAPKTEISTSISFAFTAGDRDLPPGTYIVTRHFSGQAGLQLRSLSGDVSVRLPVITRLAKSSPEKTAPHSSLVFDKLGGKSYLSEIWMGDEDGYLVRATPEAHEHVVVKHVG